MAAFTCATGCWISFESGFGLAERFFRIVRLDIPETEARMNFGEVGINREELLVDGQALGDSVSIEKNIAIAYPAAAL